MALSQVFCPACRSTLRLKSAVAVNALIKCPRCSELFRAKRPPKDEADEESPRRPARPEKGTNPLVLPLVLGGVAVGMLLLGGLVVVAFVYARSRPPAPISVVQAQAPEQPFAPPPDLGAPRDATPKPPPPEPPPAPVEPAEPPPPLPEGQARPLLVLDPTGHTARVRRVLFMPDGVRVVSVSEDKSVRVWDVRTGEVLQTFRLPSGAGNEGSTYAAALSPDGRLLAIGGAPFGRGKFGVLIHLLDLESGAVEKVLTGHRDAVSTLAFSPDGRLLASGSHDHTAILYNVATGKPEHVLEGHEEMVRGVAFSPDGRLLASASDDRTARLWTVASGKPLATMPHPASVLSIAWAPVGNVVLTGGHDNCVRLWTIEGKRRAEIKGPADEHIQFLSITPVRERAEIVYTGVGRLGVAGVLDLAAGKPRIDFKGHSNTVIHGSVSPDGSLAVSTGGDQNETLVWRLADGQVVQRLAGQGQAIWGVGWGADGKSIAWGNTNGVAAGAREPRVERAFRLDELEPGDAPAADTVRARTRGKRFAVEQLDFFTVAISENGRRARAFKIEDNRDRIYSVSIVGEDHAAVGSGFGLTLIDLNTAEVVRRFTGHEGIVLAVATSPDGRYILSGSTDQTLRLWEPNREEPLLSLFFAGDNWIAWTPEGYYAASAGGERLMGWLDNNGPDALATFHPAAQFRASLYAPDVIREVLPTGSVLKAVAKAGQQRGKPLPVVTVAHVLPPSVALTAPAPGAKLTEGRVEVKAVARSVGAHPVKALRLLVNGRPYRGRDGVVTVAEPKAGEAPASWEVELSPGRHTLTVQAESAVSKALSKPIEVVQAGAKGELPNLYVLAMGVSAYPGEMKLNYAASDAEVLSKALQERGGPLFGRVEVKVLTDGAATRQGMIEGLRWLSRKMTAKDVGVLSFSGHGTRDPRGNFYLVPADVDERNPAATCVPGDALKQVLEGMPGRLIAVLDACHSGAVGGSASGGKRRPGQALTDDLVRDLVTDDYGVIVMCSSLGREYSMESPVIKQGFFTLALVEALSGKADYNKDGHVYFHELDAYTGLRVRQMTGGMQNPVTARPPTVRTFPLARP